MHTTQVQTTRWEAMSQPRAKILVLHRESETRDRLASYFEEAGYAVTQAGTAEGLTERLLNDPADLLIVDHSVSRREGTTFMRKLRATLDIPTIALIHEQDLGDAEDLELGADDYVTQPFHRGEVLTRAQFVLRRSTRKLNALIQSHGNRASFAGWTLDLVGRDLVAPGGGAVHLTSNQFNLLAFLVSRANQVMSRQEMLGVVSGRAWRPMDRSVDVLVGKLRKKIESNPKMPRFIKTIRGVGYKFAAPVEFT